MSLASAAALLSCTGSGDGGAGDTNDYLNRGAEFASDATSATEYVDITEISGDRDSSCVAIESVRNRTTDVFAAAFTLTYDATKLSFVSWDDGDTCLGSTANRLATQVDASQPGQLIVGLSRNAAVTTTGATCGRLITLCFDVVGEGDSRMEFTGNLQLLGPPPTGTPIAVDWVSCDVQTRM